MSEDSARPGADPVSAAEGAGPDLRAGSLQTAVPPPPRVRARLEAVGESLGGALRALVEALPGRPHRPTRLGALLGSNRSVASKILSAAASRDPFEILHVTPGPEPLRKLAAAARAIPEAARTADALEAAANAFDALIHEEAGTRPALEALVTAELPGARERYELANKYSIYKGLSQLKGVQADVWFGLAVVTPAADGSAALDLTWLNGAVALRRLRPGVTVRFAYRHMRDGVTGASATTRPPLSDGGVLPLDDFCENPPARLESRQVGETIQYALPDDLLGRKQAVDMFVVDHHPGAMSREAKSPDRLRNSLFVEPAVPCAALVFDVLLHDDVFPGSDPSLFLYDTGYEGIADVNDRSRDSDRVDVVETIESLGRGAQRFTATELPRYSTMLETLATRFGWERECLRGFRTRIQYPVHGWQVAVSFERPYGG